MSCKIECKCYFVIFCLLFCLLSIHPKLFLLILCLLPLLYLLFSTYLSLKVSSKTRKEIYHSSSFYGLKLDLKVAKFAIPTFLPFVYLGIFFYIRYSCCIQFVIVIYYFSFSLHFFLSFSSLTDILIMICQWLWAIQLFQHS